MFIVGAFVAVAVHRVAWSARMFSANRLFSLVVAQAYSIFGANRAAKLAFFGTRDSGANRELAVLMAGTGVAVKLHYFAPLALLGPDHQLVN